MKDVKNAALLKNPDVVREVNRFKWLESERLGTDVGFEAAARNWLNNHSDQWISTRKEKSFTRFFKWQPLLASVKKIKFTR